MGFIFGSGGAVLTSSTGGRLPFGIPTAAIDPVTKRYTKISDDVKHRIREGAADGINEWTNKLAELSLIEVPKGPRNRDGEPDLALADSIRFPGNDPAHAAHADFLDATVEYDTDYAAAQHEGEAWMTRTDLAGGVYEVHWVVESYTTPGTKSHYLEDPLKAMLPFQEEYVAKHVRAVLQ